MFHFAPFESLMQLEDWGMLDRERTLLAALAPHYGRVVVMTYGGADDSGLIDRLPERATLVCNSEGLDTAEYLGTVPSRVCRELEGVRTAVVRTHQMWHGDVAVNTALALRDSGVRTGLIARCGYVWSQFFARSHGASDPRSVEARHVEGEVCRAADVVIATTQRMLDDLSWAHGLDASRTRLIPNYVLDDEPVAGEGARDPQRVLYAGRLTAQKRLDLLIDAVAMLPADLGVVLSIIGQGELEGELRERAERAGVRAEFGPRVPHREMLHAMRRCGVYAQTSAYEGHPRTVIEAMSTGAPTLV
ncbi:MAG: glycosyltransferase family 4 protein, partial [Planctomycetota bacterium]